MHEYGRKEATNRCPVFVVSLILIGDLHARNGLNRRVPHSHALITTHLSVGSAWSTSWLFAPAAAASDVATDLVRLGGSAIG